MPHRTNQDPVVRATRYLQNLLSQGVPLRSLADALATAAESLPYGTVKDKYGDSIDPGDLDTAISNLRESLY